MTRTDVHAPKNLKPEDYEFVACGNFPTAELDGFSPLASTHRHVIDEGWTFADTSEETGRGCQHCGAFLVYYAILKHLPSHRLIRVGETCLDNRFSLANAEFQKLRKAAKLNRERRKLSDKRDAFLSGTLNDGSLMRDLYEWAKEQSAFDRDGYAESFEAKFVRFIDRFGEVSDKFIAAIQRSKVRQAEWAAKKAEEAKTAAPVIEGKITVTGEILSLKWRDSAYGGALKMVVRDDRGFKVWGTVPSNVLAQLDVNLAALHTDGNAHYYKDLLPQRIIFAATIKKSDDDATFGFFSRPTNANLI